MFQKQITHLALTLILLLPVLAQAQYQGIAPSQKQKAQQVYANLNNTPMQQKVKKNQKVFVGAVYWAPEALPAATYATEFKKMRSLGYNVVRFHNMDVSEQNTQTFLDQAHKAGLGVIFHLNFAKVPHWYKKKIGLTVDYQAEIPKYFGTLHFENQTHKTLSFKYLEYTVNKFKDHPALYCWNVFGEPEIAQITSVDDSRQQFANYLKQKYQTLENLNQAWNPYPKSSRPLLWDFSQAYKYTGKVGYVPTIQPEKSAGILRNYGATRDYLRFLADKTLTETEAFFKFFDSLDSQHPHIIGSHNLLLNHPSLGWDMGKWARIGDMHYSSIHLPWHYGLAQGEIDIPCIVQSKLTHEFFKGGWSSAFETTGGAVQYSGGYGNSMNPGLMRRLMLSYLAGGNQGIGFWVWNHRPGGWEVGEYGLTSLAGELTPWAIESGKVTKAMLKYKDEIWQYQTKSKAAILLSWDTEAILLNEPERHDRKNLGAEDLSSGVKMEAKMAALGTARALINNNIDFEFITTAELQEGIATKYDVILAPHLRALKNKDMQALNQYVDKGGVLIADMFCGFLTQWGIMRPTGQGSIYDQIFGGWPQAIHDARTEDLKLNGMPVNGFFSDLKPNLATVQSYFNDGRPALLAYQKGRGMAFMAGWDFGLASFKNNAANHWSQYLASIVATVAKPDFKVSNHVITIKKCTPKADHYFIFNPKHAKQVIINFENQNYKKYELVIENKPIEPLTHNTITVPIAKESAVWLRASK